MSVIPIRGNLNPRVYLYSTTDTLVKSSSLDGPGDSGKTEPYQVTTTGNYSVKVDLYSGSGDYLLQVFRGRNDDIKFEKERDGIASSSSDLAYMRMYSLDGAVASRQHLGMLDDNDADAWAVHCLAGDQLEFSMKFWDNETAAKVANAMSVSSAFESSPEFTVEMGTDATIAVSLQSPIAAMDIISAVMSASGDPYILHSKRYSHRKADANRFWRCP